MNEKAQTPSQWALFMKHGWPIISFYIILPIFCLLIGMIIPNCAKRSEESRRTKAIVQMGELIRALELYKRDNDRYPTTEQGLEALAEKPAIKPVPEHWKQYMDKTPRDPWRNEYVYQCPGTNAPYDLICLGPDGKRSDDDIVSWNLPDE